MTCHSHPHQREELYLLRKPGRAEKVVLYRRALGSILASNRSGRKHGRTFGELLASGEMLCPEML
jgi:hypothetical protein